MVMKGEIKMSTEKMFTPYSWLDNRRLVCSQLEKPTRSVRMDNLSSLTKEVNELEKMQPATGTAEGEDLNYRRTLLEKRKKDSPDFDVAVYLNLFEEDMVIDGKTSWEILGVDEDTPIFEVHKQYRMLARSFHPDKVRGRLREMEEIFFQGEADQTGILRGYRDREEQITEIILKKEQELLKRYQAMLVEKIGEVVNDLELVLPISNDDYQKLSSEQQGIYSKIFIKYKKAKKEIKKNDEVLNAWREIEVDLMEKAEKKMRQINTAWEMIKKGLTEEQVIGLESIWLEDFSDPGRQVISLKADAEIWRKIDYQVLANGNVKLGRPAMSFLSFGTGQVDWRHDDYVGIVAVKSLFAFLEHKSGKKISKNLLTDIAEKYDLDLYALNELVELFYKGVGSEEMVRLLGIERVVSLGGDLIYDSYDEARSSGWWVTSDFVTIAEILAENFNNQKRAGDILEEMFREDKFVREGLVDGRLENVNLEKDVFEKMVEFGKNNLVEVVKKWENWLRQKAYKFSQESNLEFKDVYLIMQKKEDKSRMIDFLQRKLVWMFKRKQFAPERLKDDLDEIYNGPKYDDYSGSNFGNPVSRRVGVEIGSDGLRLILPFLESAHEQCLLAENEYKEIFLGKKDIAILKQLAYGRMVEGGGKTG